MDASKFEVFLAKAISKAKASKKPLLVLVNGSKDVENGPKTAWIDGWIDKENIDSIERFNAAVLLYVVYGNNANFQFFKNYARNLMNYDEHAGVFDQNESSLFIIVGNSIQEVIQDTSDAEDCNAILTMFISPYKEVEQKEVSKEILKEEKEQRGQAETQNTENEQLPLNQEAKMVTNKTDVSVLTPHEESERKYRASLKKAQAQARLERERVRKLIEQDKQDKKERFQFNPKGVQEEPVEPETVKDHIHNKQRISEAKECKLSIKTFDNRNIVCTFKSSDSLDTVRKYLVEAEKLENDFNFHRNIPRMTFKDIDEFSSLKDLDLLPRSALILEPRNTFQSTNSKQYFDAQNGSFRGITDILYSWWNGRRNESAPTDVGEESDREERETYNGNSTNVIDPKETKDK